MTGTATKDTIGSIGISFSVMKPGELVEEIGSGNYNLEPNSDRININYSTCESTKADFVEYMEEIVSAVKTHFSESYGKKDTIDDEDAGDGTTMRRWYATMVANGTMVDWEDVI